MKIAVILGSTRTKFRLGERVAKWVMSETKKYQAEFTLLDLRDYNLPFFDEEIGPRGNKNRNPSENVAKWCSDIASADGYIFITPEYNYTINAALKNAIDLLAFEAKRKPAAFIGYSDGANGGMYAVHELRVIANMLEMIPVPTKQIILNADKVISEDGVAQSDHAEDLERRFSRLMEDLLWYTEALKTARDRK